MANEKAKKKSADKTADKSAKNDKNGKNGKTAAEKTADKATACYNSLKKNNKKNGKFFTILPCLISHINTI